MPFDRGDHVLWVAKRYNCMVERLPSLIVTNNKIVWTPCVNCLRVTYDHQQNKHGKSNLENDFLESLTSCLMFNRNHVNSERFQKADTNFSIHDFCDEVRNNSCLHAGYSESEVRNKTNQNMWSFPERSGVNRLVHIFLEMYCLDALTLLVCSEND